MRQLLIFLSLTTIIAAQNHPDSITEKEIAGVFEAHKARGTFVLYNLNKDTTITYNTARADSSALPASTFKIFNSLVILEEGVIKDPLEVLTWPGKKSWVKQWNRDHNMKTAIQYSVVWFYQHCARLVGEQRMQYWLNAAGYGNKNLSGGIDQFWLNGGLRISAQQQVRFLYKLYKGTLPFSEKVQNTVKEIMLRDKSADFILRAKTGWAGGEKPQIGWYVGYLEQNNNVYFFAMNMDIYSMADTKKRRAITYDVFNISKTR